jgi:hypothetical protein
MNVKEQWRFDHFCAKKIYCVEKKIRLSCCVTVGCYMQLILSVIYWVAGKMKILLPVSFGSTLFTYKWSYLWVLYWFEPKDLFCVYWPQMTKQKLLSNNSLNTILWNIFSILNLEFEVKREKVQIFSVNFILEWFLVILLRS